VQIVRVSSEICFDTHVASVRCSSFVWVQVTMMAGKSVSVPFMPRPEKLDGTMAGDVGFGKCFDDQPASRWHSGMNAVIEMCLQEA
jgi:hypothetical protein